MTNDTAPEEEQGDVLDFDDWETTYTIGALFDLSDVLDRQGEISSVAANIAVEDVNHWLQSEGRPWRLNLIIEDTGLDSEKALKLLEKMHITGVNLIVGPKTSIEAIGLLDYANSNQILLVSPAAFSSSLSFSDDWFYRFVTDELFEADALAVLSHVLELDQVIFAWQDISWVNNVQKATEKLIIEQGIDASSAKFSFNDDPQSIEFTTTQMNSHIAELIELGFSPEKIGIIFLPYNNGELLLTSAAEQEELFKVRWLISGMNLEGIISSNAAAKDFAAEVELLYPLESSPELPPQSYQKGLMAQLINIFDLEPDSYLFKAAFSTYDIIWALALSIDQAGYDSVAIKAILPEVTEKWSAEYGASGHIILNEYGDRTYGNYDLWAVDESGQWEQVGYYDNTEKTISWFDFGH